MIYMHKKSGEFIIVSWKNDLAVHIQSESSHGVCLLSQWKIISENYEHIGEL
jgi:hypothetical protein